MDLGGGGDESELFMGSDEDPLIHFAGAQRQRSKAQGALGDAGVGACIGSAEYFQVAE